MNRIRELREQRGISQKELSIEISVKQPSVCSWEKGIKEPSSANARKLADYFGVSMDFLLGRSCDNDASKKQPTVDVDSELRKRIIDRVKNLSDPALEHAWAYLEGLRAGQEIEQAKPTDRDPDSSQPE